MCGCMGCSRYPAGGSGIFKKLRSGDEVKIQAGRGDPETTEEVTEVIAEVSGFSALTNTGRKLMCTDASGIATTGNRPGYKVSPKAQRLLEKQGIQKALGAALSGESDESGLFAEGGEGDHA